MRLSGDGKHFLKILRWRYRRFQAARKWGSSALNQSPAVLGNAMPKSGSHLINQVVQGLVNIGPYVNPGFPPVNRDEENEKLLDDAVLANLRSMKPGDIGYGYIKAARPYVSLLDTAGRATIFVYRDPRDMIISHVFYATQMHTGHGMHRYYNESLHTMEERIHAAIEGVDQPGSELSPILAKYLGYMGWLNIPSILCMRFEDLILDQRNSLDRIISYLADRGHHSVLSREAEIDALQRAIAPHKSGTYRKGKPGNWREHFTPGNIDFFKAKTGDLLVRLGYEESMNWS